MGVSGMIQGVAAAASAGVGCGSCCASGIGAFLPGYLVTHAKSVGESVRAFCSFYLGKIVAVALLCVASSILGNQILDEAGRIGVVRMDLAADFFMLAMGAGFVVKWFWDRARKQDGSARCGSCGHSGSTRTAVLEQRISYPALFGMGAGYGVMPCAPLLLMVGVSVSISPLAAGVSGSVFALSSALVPFFILAILSGLLSKNLRKELPGYLEYFQLFTYVVLLVVYGMDLIREF